MAADLIVRTYDPKLIIVTFGTVPIVGFASGTFLTITGNGDKFEKDRGADGTVDRINKNAYDYSVALTLKQTSLTNDALSAINIADMLSNAGKLPLTIKDLNGNELFFAAQAWIAKDPDDAYGDSLDTREWRIDTGIAAKFTGGNVL